MKIVIQKLKQKLGFLFKLNDLLEKKERLQLIKVLVVDLAMGLFQAIGVLSILPFMTMVMNPSVIEENKYLIYFYQLFNFFNLNTFMFTVGVLVLLLLLVGNVISVFAIRIKTKFVWDLNYRMSSSLLGKYLSLPYSYFLEHNSADLSKQILVEVQQLAAGFLLSVLNIVEGLAIASVLFLMLILVNPKITLVTLFLLGSIYIIIYLIFSKRLKKAGKERIELYRLRYKSVAEALGGIKFTKVLGKEEFFLEGYSKHSKRVFNLESWSQVLGKTPKYIMELVAFGGVLSLVLYFVYTEQMSKELISLLGFFAFAGYRLMPALQSVFDSFTQFRFHRAVLNKIHHDMYGEGLAEVKVDLTDQVVKQIEFKKQIKLDNISFSYEGNRKRVLEDMEMEIKKGMSVGIVGSTGSGKTTLVDIILGLLTPTKGNIFVDGIKITKENVRNWQANLGYVPQDIFLCDDTITKNIAFGYSEEDIDMEQVQRVAKMANIGKFIETELPDKYDTIIGERGVRLSGGQRQRIGIARALYHNPEVLVFDEATSSLDNVTERSVLKAIERVSKLKTMIVIAHRLTTVKNCNTIYLIDKGRIVDKGKYEELEEESEKFKEMVGQEM